MPKIDFICVGAKSDLWRHGMGVCLGDSPATRTTTAYWDVDAQIWVMNSDMEMAYCPECGGDVRETTLVP